MQNKNRNEIKINLSMSTNIMEGWKNKSNIALFVGSFGHHDLRFVIDLSLKDRNLQWLQKSSANAPELPSFLRKNISMCFGYLLSFRLLQVLSSCRVFLSSHYLVTMAPGEVVSHDADPIALNRPTRLCRQ